jgi:hypothetical protein
LGGSSTASAASASGGIAEASAAILGRLGASAHADQQLGGAVPIASFTDKHGHSCQLFLQNVMIDGRPASASASLCRQPTGRWALSTAEPPAKVALATRERGICPRPGTIIETSLGATFQFTRADGPRCWFRTSGGVEDSRYAHLLGGESTWLRQGGSRLRELFPPKEGARRWFVVSGVTTTGFPTSWYETYTVSGRERVRVKAGTFDTYVIDWEEEGREGNGWTAHHRFWYAPSLGYFVKFVADKRPGNTLADWEATRVVVPEPLPEREIAAAPPRKHQTARR